MEKLIDIKRQNYLFNGVYKITNIKNNKFYIGSSSSKYYLYIRLKHHKNDLSNNKHINKYLQKSWNKYTKDAFYIEILEKCSPEKCIEREQYWINLLQPKYNLCKNAGSSFGTIPSKETKLKISNSNKQWYKTKEGIEFKNKLSKLKKGKKGYNHTQEHKEKISNLFKGRKFSEKTLQKMKCKRPSLYKKVIDLNTKIIYTNAEEYAKLFNINTSYVQALCRREKISKKHNVEYYE